LQQQQTQPCAENEVKTLRFVGSNSKIKPNLRCVALVKHVARHVAATLRVTGAAQVREI
jgi:hypothetical protein